MNFSQENSDYIYTIIRSYDVTPVVDVNALGGYSAALDLRNQTGYPDDPNKVLTAVPFACAQKQNWNNGGIASIFDGVNLRISTNTSAVMNVRVLYLMRK